MIRLDELTRGDILKNASPEPWKAPMSARIMPYKFNLVDVLLSEKDNLCVVRFKTEADGHTTQYVRVNLCDFWEYYRQNEKDSKQLSIASLLNLILMHGEVQIYCSCPHWVYGGYNYIATQLGYAFDKQEERFPKKKNPKLMGTLCKHAFLILKNLPYQKFGMAAFIKRAIERGDY